MNRTELLHMMLSRFATRLDLDRLRLSFHREILLAVLILFASCAGQEKSCPLIESNGQGNLSVGLSDITWEHIYAELSSSDPYAVPELQSVESQSVELLGVKDFKGNEWTVAVFQKPSLTIPGDSLSVAYLLDSQGKVLDWKSQWLSSGEGRLRVKLLDVNNDGLKDLSFISCPYEQKEGFVQLISAYGITANGSFLPVILERHVHFRLKMSDWDGDAGLATKIQIENSILSHTMRTGKLYKASVRIVNRSTKSIDLNDYGLVFEGGDAGCSYSYSRDVGELGAGDSVDVLVTILFSQKPKADQAYFWLKQRD